MCTTVGSSSEDRIRPVDLGVVVPSAYPIDLLRRTLPALRHSLDVAGVDPARAVLLDERPSRGGLRELVGGLGLRIVTTGGIGNGPARNQGAAAVDGDWLLFVDDDVELDPVAVSRALEAGHLAGGQRIAAVIGGLRPPPGTPRWLQWTYDDGTVNPASASAPPGLLPAAGLAATVLLIERRLFERAGGFPADPGWGWTDARLGLGLERLLGRGARVLRVPSISGIHWYTPSWAEWLQRLERAGHRLGELCPQLDEHDYERLLDIAALGPGPKTAIKLALSRLPTGFWRFAFGRPLRKAAGSASIARGLRLAGSKTPPEEARIHRAL